MKPNAGTTNLSLSPEELICGLFNYALYNSGILRTEYALLFFVALNCTSTSMLIICFLVL
jgi:hypothetical protein